MTAPQEMTCREVVDAITDYLEGTMPEEDRRRFDAHVALCPYCMNYLEQMRETVAALRGLREESIAPQTRAELIQAFRGWREQRV